MKLFSANTKLIWSPLWVRLPKPLLGLLSPRCQGCEGSMVQLGEEETQSFLGRVLKLAANPDGLCKNGSYAYISLSQNS